MMLGCKGLTANRASLIVLAEARFSACEKMRDGLGRGPPRV